jgi:hypothetical protein
MSEISKTGGGIHCMAQALRRESGLTQRLATIRKANRSPG